MMANRIILGSVLFLALTAHDALAALRVVTTVPTLAALASEVGGDQVEVRSLSLSTQDPHFVDPKPNLVLALNRADVLVMVGADLEIGWLRTLQTGARNPRISQGGNGLVDCSMHVKLRDVTGGQADRSMGDIHPQGNPHYLTDPSEAIQCARAIAKVFAAVDSGHAPAYQQRLQAFEETIAQKTKAWKIKMDSLRGMRVVPYHKSWTYLVNWLDLEVVEHLEPRPGIPPSPSHVARVIARMRETGVKAVIQESYFPTTMSRLAAEKSGAALVVLPGGVGFTKDQTYAGYIDEILQALAKAKKGESR